MSRKRRNTSSPEPDNSPISNSSLEDFHWNEVAQDEFDTSDEKPQVDPFSGQTGAFPGLAQDNGELFYGPASDGLDYLRMVRSEARGVPSLLVGDRTNNADIPECEEGKLQRGGYYADGAYTAIPSMVDEPEHIIPATQQEYYKSLLTQFRVVKATLNCIPPLVEIEKLTSDYPISFPSGSKIARQQWEEQILSKDPHPVQIACMDFDSLTELLKFLKRKLIILLRTSDDETRTRLATWIWSLLGKYRNIGELSSEEVGELRDLGQKAARMLNSSTSAIAEVDRNGEQLEEMDGNMTNTQIIDDESSIVLGEKFEVNHQDVESLDLVRRERQLCMILDMIVTIVGEIYGQSDLLELRPLWIEA